MDERDQQRKVRHRLGVLRHGEEVSGSVAAACRCYGISRTVFYKWRNRFEELGAEGLRDRSSKPHHSPRATRSEVVAKIVYLRQHYHFGPLKISMYLKRYHDIEISNSGVWRILDRLGMGRLPADQRYRRHKQRWKRYEKPQPGHQVQIDVKFIAPIAGVTANKHYQFTAIDDCARIRVLRVYPKNNQKTAIQFLDYLLERLPFRVESIQTDNGAEFQSGFHWHVSDRGIRHTCIKPATPRLNGKVCEDCGGAASNASTEPPPTNSSTTANSDQSPTDDADSKPGSTTTISTATTPPSQAHPPTAYTTSMDSTP